MASSIICSSHLIHQHSKLKAEIHSILLSQPSKPEFQQQDDVLEDPDPEPFRQSLRNRENLCRQSRRLITAYEIQEIEFYHRDSVGNRYAYSEQTSTVNRHYNEFCEWKHWADILYGGEDSEEFVVSLFIRGLKEEIRNYLPFPLPSTMLAAFISAVSAEIAWNITEGLKEAFDKFTPRKPVENQESTHDEEVTKLADTNSKSEERHLSQGDLVVEGSEAEDGGVKVQQCESDIQEISRQLCLEHQLSFSKMVSFDDNTQFMIAVLRECGLAHRTIIFVLDEFDLFTQGKQRLLYSLLDAMQSVSSQAVVIGVSCRLDADQLLEKRVRSRFSHRKLLFLPPSEEGIKRLMEHILTLPTKSVLPDEYVLEFNAKLHDVLVGERLKEILNTLLSSDSTVSNLLKFLFRAVSFMDLESGHLAIENFRSALPCVERKPKLESLQGCSILELYILVSMKRLEVKEESSYNFNSIMKEYKSIHDSFQTSDHYSRAVCLRAFEHLLKRELVCFTDNRGNSQSLEFRPVKLLISINELYQGLKSYRSCPAILQRLVERDN